MQKILFFLILSIWYLNLIGQVTPIYLSVKEISQTPWNVQTGITYKQVPGANLGPTSFEVMDNNRIAFLCDSNNEIIIVEKSNGKAIKKFNVSLAPRDFSFSNGNFFVLTENEVIKYDAEGNVINSFPIPYGYYGIERLTRYNDATYLLLPSGNSLMIESNGYSITDNEKEGWITSAGNYVITRISGNNTYYIKVTTENRNTYEKIFSTVNKIAGVFVVGSTNSLIVLDVQTFISENPVTVDRMIVNIDLSNSGLGSISAHTKIPDCYYVLSNKDFSLLQDGTVYNMITSPQGVYIFSLTNENALLKTQNIQGYPTHITETKYHFNNYLIKGEEK